MTGIKLLTVPAPGGKLTPELVAREAWGWGDEHRAQPLAVSITQATEMGTIYTPEEVRAISDFAHRHDMAVHMDGSRLWNAAAALGVPFREFTVDAGVDILSLGGTKNGLLGAEAVVVLAPERAVGLIYLRKLTMQLASKMRFASAQLLALFDDGLGVRSAAHANAMAARLRSALDGRHRRRIAAGTGLHAGQSSERDLRHPPNGRGGPHPRAGALLRLGSRARRGALDDRVGYDGGRRRRLRRRHPRGVRARLGRRYQRRTACVGDRIPPPAVVACERLRPDAQRTADICRRVPPLTTITSQGLWPDA